MIQKFVSKKLALALLGVLCAFSMGTAAADTSLQTVVQSYKSDATLQAGMIVKLDSKDSSKVEPATLATIKKMTGVVVTPEEAAVTLSAPASSTQQIFVATSGRYYVLVSNQTGTINIGDYITVSSLDGIGMKADTHEETVLGKAAAGFDGVHGVSSNTTVKNKNGKTVSVAVGRIPVDITIGPNPNSQSVSNLPGLLQHASFAIANKSVSSWRIYLGLIVVVGTLLVSGSLLYGGVRNGMVAIGRNPLARSSITRNLVQVVIVSVIILVVGLFAVYLLLKL